MYITNISHITQSDKDKIFDKTKTIRPKTWSIDFTKIPLMTYHLPKTNIHSLLSQFSPRFFFFFFWVLASFCPYVGPSRLIAWSKMVFNFSLKTKNKKREG